MREKVVACLAVAALWIVSGPVSSADEGSAPPTPGSLVTRAKAGRPQRICPLEHTDVETEISGFLARVTVTQRFSNPSNRPVDAVYTFPLSAKAAVDRMTMKVGERTVTGTIKRKEEARRIYDAARKAGQVASLLDQERPNIFTQSVANIMPGERVLITISYVETLDYRDGSYRFVFPMVVGPRYVSGGVPDAAQITPSVAGPESRAGHDVSLKVTLDAGVPLMDLKSTLHAVDVQRTSDRSAVVELQDKATIPNKDFIVTYDVAGGKIEDAVMVHRDERGGFFTLILQPPDRAPSEDVSPKELVFVLDTSGSMSGFPIEKAKECIRLALDGLYPSDTFNLVTFAGETSVLFPEPVPATPENLAAAQEFLDSRRGAGGTEMMTAIRTALEPSDQQDHLRIVCFMTDGFVGNDMAIVGEIQKHPNARVFSFGIGNSVNRFLLDKMADEGRGEAEFVTLDDDGSAAARRFHERVRSPLLTDVTVDWAGLRVTDVSPRRIPDVFSAKPIVVTGRYTTAGKATIRIAGRQGGRDVVREVAVDLPEREPAHDALASLWARQRVEDLMSEDWAGIQRGTPRPDVQDSITRLGLDYGLVTQFTSFVAVEERVVRRGGKSRRIQVPVAVPDGVEDGEDEPVGKGGSDPFKRSPRPIAGAVATGVPGGVPGGVSSPPPAARPALAPPPVQMPPPTVVRLSTVNLTSSATTKVRPDYPDTARQAKVEGTVVVEVTVDEKGAVIAARAVSGHPLLRDVCLTAARRWQFKPYQLGGRAVRVIGLLSFTFPTPNRE